MNAARTTTNGLTGHGLVVPEESAHEDRALARAYTRYLAACCRRFLNIGDQLAVELRPAHERIATLVRGVLLDRRGQMLSCFASPMVGTPLQCIELRRNMEVFQARIDKAVAEMMPHLLLEMALRRLIPSGQSVLWNHGAPRLASLALGGELIPPQGASGLRFSPSHIAAIADGAERARITVDLQTMHAACGDSGCDFGFERRFWRTGKVSYLATVDHNPIAAFEAHPDKAGNHIDLGGRPPAEWIAVLDESFALVEHFLPGEFAEMALMLHEIIPVGYDTTRHLSASYREAIGTAYLTLHPNVMTMTEAVIHEFQHNKFNVSSYSTEFLLNAFHPLYRSPIRPDPRPLWGIFLAVHAFLPVAELYRRMRDANHPWAAVPEFDQRMSDIDLKNHEGMEMLRAHARFTAAGRAMFDDLEQMECRHLADRAARGLDNTPSAIHLA